MADISMLAKRLQRSAYATAEAVAAACALLLLTAWTSMDACSAASLAIVAVFVLLPAQRIGRLSLPMKPLRWLAAGSVAALAAASLLQAVTGVVISPAAVGVPVAAVAWLSLSVAVAGVDIVVRRPARAFIRSLISLAVAIAVGGALAAYLHADAVFGDGGIWHLPPATAAGIVFAALALQLRLHRHHAARDGAEAAVAASAQAGAATVMLIAVAAAALAMLAGQRQQIEADAARTLLPAVRQSATQVADAIQRNTVAPPAAQNSDLVRYLERWNRSPRDGAIQEVVQRVAQDWLSSGFSSVAILGLHESEVRAGAAATAGGELPIANRPGEALLWQDGLQLRSRIPVRSDSGLVVGYVTLERVVPELQRLLSAPPVPAAARLLLCGGPAATPLCLSPSAGLSPSAVAGDGISITTAADGSRSFHAVAAVADSGLQLRLQAPAAPFYRPLRAEALRALPLFAAVAALALAALWPLIAALARAVRRANELSKRSHARFVMAAESVYETFTTLDCVRDGDGSIIDFRFTFCTEGHTARHGTSRTDMVGRCLSELFPDYRASGVFDRYRRVVDTGEPFVKEIEVSDPETMAKWIEMHVVRHGDGVAVTTSDISERKLFDGVQRESETRFRLLAENSQDMIFRIDTDGTVLYASPAARAIFGCDPDALVAQRLEQWAHPDDAERFADLLTSLMVGGIKDAALVQRMRASEGDWRWIELQMHAITDGASGVSEIQGALRDIGARHAAEEAVRANEARLVAATESIHDSFTVYEAVRDGNGAVVDFRYSFINAAGARSLGRPAQELQGRLLCELNPRARASGFFAQCQRVLESGESCSGELRLERAGEEVWVDLKIVRVGDRGEVAVTYRDISERKRAELLLQESEARMRQMAHYDGLTHLPNRMLFFERLGEAMARAYRAEHPLVVMFIDVDHFKQFNDTYGHAGGDEVLRVVARRLSAAVRSSDTVARFAGDEFTIILESIRSLAEARVVGIKLLEAMRAPIRLGAEEVRVTLSVGAAYLERETVSADALVHVADAALYEVKQNGRNGFHASVVGSAAEIAAKEALYRQLLQP